MTVNAVIGILPSSLTRLSRGSGATEYEDTRRDVRSPDSVQRAGRAAPGVGHRGLRDRAAEFAGRERSSVVPVAIPING